MRIQSFSFWYRFFRFFLLLNFKNHFSFHSAQIQFHRYGQSVNKMWCSFARLKKKRTESLCNENQKNVPNLKNVIFWLRGCSGGCNSMHNMLAIRIAIYDLLAFNWYHWHQPSCNFFFKYSFIMDQLWTSPVIWQLWLMPTNAAFNW